MPSYLSLQHLTFIGAGVPPARLEFSPRLTVLHGASDTGKSFVCSAIDYMFRGRLKDIPETQRYRDVLLGLLPADREPMTLVRRLHGGGDARIYPYESRRVPTEAAPQILTTSNAGRKGVDSLSAFLLQLMDMERATIRRKIDGTTRKLGIRDIAHLAIIDETKMQSPVSPALQGQFVTQTAERSVMKYLLTGEDDEPTEEQVTDVERRVTNAQREVLQSIISELRNELRESASVAALTDGIVVLDERISSATDDIAGLVAARGTALDAVDKQRAARAEIVSRIEELKQLGARFSLLARQYESDLRRLALLSETGDLLGLFRPDMCLFCGSRISDHDAAHPDVQVTVPLEFGLAVEAERERVSSLLGDLRGTLEDVEAEASTSAAVAAQMDVSIASLTAEFQRIDEALQPRQVDLRILLDARDTANRLLAQWEHVSRLEAQMPDPPPPRGTSADGDRDGGLEAATRELAAKLRAVLVAWDFPRAENVRLDNDFEPIVDDRRRRDRGKGVRAMQHAAFTVALAEYCFERDLPHPGFVVLDSPLVTYREPEADDLQAAPAVPDAFYRYLANDFPGQAVVLENTPPPELGGDAVVLHLTGIEGSGRYGFF